MSQSRDLFGRPILPPRETRGRPEHQASEEIRFQIAGLRAFGKTQEEIAAGLGLSVRTLRKYYLPELKGGAEQFKVKALVVLAKQALVENKTPALKELLKRLDTMDLPGATRAVPDEKPVRIGKKAQAKLDAEQPDQSTSMGELMAQRTAEITRH